MALTVNYKVSPDATLARLYRSIGSKIDLTNLPANPTVLDKTKTQYVYPDGVNNTHYSFVVETTDINGNKNFSSIQDILYKTELGPGPTKVTRGYFDFGVFGEVSSEELGANPHALRDYINTISGNCPALDGPTGQGWFKCLVNKKIIYIPKDVRFYHGASVSYTKAVLYPTRLCDDNGLFDDCPIITLKGRQYKWRSLAHHDTSLTGAAALAAIKDIGSGTFLTKQRSEIMMMVCLTASNYGGADFDGLGLPVAPSTGGAPFRAGELKPFNNDPAFKAYGMGTTGWPNNGSGIFAYQANPPSLGQQGVSSSSPYYVCSVPILELLD
ncbi:hypothetical protein [Shewanella phage FishSpeaker]|nr:hypothetical protein [Shewanella phage FishSpeaker]